MALAEGAVRAPGWAKQPWIGASNDMQQQHRREQGRAHCSQADVPLGPARSVPPPHAPHASHHHHQQQQQQRHVLRGFSGCMHCIVCLELRSFRHSASRYKSSTKPGGQARPTPTAAAAEEWWPSGLSTPTLYFHLRLRQLHLQYRQAASAEGAAKLWRPTSETRNEASALLAARRHRPLGLLIPNLYTNVHQSDSGVQLVGIKTVPLWAYPAAASTGVAAAAAAAAVAQQQRAEEEREQNAELMVCCNSSKELPCLSSIEREASATALVAAGPAAVATVAPAAAAAKRGTLENFAAVLSPAKRHRGLTVAMWRSMAAPAAPQHGPQPWLMQQQQQQQAQVQAQAAMQPIGSSIVPSPAPPSCGASACTPLQFPLSASLPPAPLSSNSSFTLASSTSSAMSDMLLGTSSATSVLPPLQPSGTVYPGGGLMAAACGMPTDEQERQRARQLLEVKMTRAFPCGAVVLDLPPREEPPLLAAPSLLGSLLAFFKV